MPKPTVDEFFGSISSVEGRYELVAGCARPVARANQRHNLIRSNVLTALIPAPAPPAQAAVANPTNVGAPSNGSASGEPGDGSDIKSSGAAFDWNSYSYLAIFDEDGHIAHRVDLHRLNEAVVRERAKQPLDGHAVELWDGATKLARFEPIQRH